MSPRITLASRPEGRRHYPKALTWAGHEFLDAARNDTIWNEAKTQVGKSLLSVPFEVLKGLLAQIAKRAVGLE